MVAFFVMPLDRGLRDRLQAVSRQEVVLQVVPAGHVQTYWHVPVWSTSVLPGH